MDCICRHCGETFSTDQDPPPVTCPSCLAKKAKALFAEVVSVIAVSVHCPHCGADELHWTEKEGLHQHSPDGEIIHHFGQEYECIVCDEWVVLPDVFYHLTGTHK